MSGNILSTSLTDVNAQDLHLPNAETEIGLRGGCVNSLFRLANLTTSPSPRLAKTCWQGPVFLGMG
jgi:hypothetical protein